MIEDYFKFLNPDSLLDVVDESILQSLMQGFFYRERTGLSIVYDSPVPGQDNQPYHVLHPFPKFDCRNSDVLNPFCWLLRQLPERDKACTDCDMRYAGQLIGGTIELSTRYPCHMGLDDFRFPIKLGGRVRAVIICGQRPPKENPKQMEFIRVRIQEAAPELADKLWPLIEETAISGKDADEHESRFKRFGETVQKVVSAIYEARRSQAMQKAIVEIHEILGREVIPEEQAWVSAAEGVFDALNKNPRVPRLVFYARKGSRYMAAARTKTLRGTTLPNLPVAMVVQFPTAQWVEVRRTNPLFSSFRPGLVDDSETTIWLYREDARGGANAAISGLLASVGPPGAGTSELLAATATAVAQQASVAMLINRMAQQRLDLEREVAFTAHSMKTPIQSALFQVRKLRRAANGVPLTAEQCGELATRIGDELTLAIHDARQLQFAIKENRKPVSLHSLLNALAVSREVLATARGCGIKLDLTKEGSDLVWGEESQLRVAFSNVLENAIKYTFDREMIRVVTRGLNNRDFTVKIINIGVGFDKIEMERQFEVGGRSQTPDARRERHGGGLGVAQAKLYLEDHGGSLHIASIKQPRANLDSLAHITTITVTLPIYRKS